VQDLILEVEVFDREFLELLRREPLQNLLHRFQEVEEARLAGDLVFPFLHRESFAEEAADENLPVQKRPFGELQGSLLEALVLQKPADQLGPGVLLLLLSLSLFPLRSRQKHLGFDMEQGGGHQKKLPGNVQVQVFHQLQVFQVLLGDGRDGDVVNIDLILLDQIQKQVHGPFEGIQLHLQGQLHLFRFVVK
jgi:hypothetical protein